MTFLIAESVCVDSVSGLGLQTKENIFSVTIDITDIMFHVMLNVCGA